MPIPEISPAEARVRCRDGAVLIDVREPHEHALGMAEGAQGVAMGELIANPSIYLPAGDVEVLLICQGGVRSLRTAEALAAQGFDRLCSVEGGTTRWVAESLPITMPEGELDADFAERYSRHLRLPQVGVDGQRRLEAARVLMIGAGGLGSPAAYYLAAAGIGHLRIADDDVVDRSNLQRQILHTEARIGVAKVDSAAQALSALNPRVRIEAVRERVTAANVDRLLDGIDVVVDGADNFAARYLLNDACVRHGKPLVYGAVHRFEGQASVFDAGRRRGEAPCYRCLFPEPPPPEAAPNCAEAGVLGVLPGLVGLIQATEAIKLILGIGTSLSGRLLHVDALSMRFRETRLPVDPDCPTCAPGRAFTGYVDEAVACASDPDSR
ncbi:molybdopterin-synthase adenylyltransferase MoeB [Lysobacter brunescens]|uniref:Molybdopterin-synthase adenylyltransferase MoeB n=1 Tax=Lysobacter brunescens TaxID=262323 RepID=A0ABW2YGR6_9GAMM